MRLIALASGPSVLLLLAGCGGDARDVKPPAVSTAAQDKTEPKISTPKIKEASPVLPGDVPAPKPPEQKSSGGKDAAAAGDWGTLKGRIVGVGNFPKREPVKINPMHSDRKFCLKDGEFLDEDWIVDPKSKGLKDVFVWLAPADKEGKLAIHPQRSKIAADEDKVVMDQPVCMFIPHALALREGQTLVVKNSSKVPHSFKWSGDPAITDGGNKTIASGEQLEIALKADRINYNCALHGWMKGTLHVFDHPYFAVTDDQGRFEFKDAPTGPCRLMIRHHSGFFPGGRKGRDGRPITIEAGDGDLGTIEFPAPPPPT